MPKLKLFSTNSRSTTKPDQSVAGIAAGLLLVMTSGTSVGAMNECEFSIRKMNKLGSRMSLLRMTIASTDDKDKRDLASQQLEQHNIDYHLAKKLFKKANCGDTWSRD